MLCACIVSLALITLVRASETTYPLVISTAKLDAQDLAKTETNLRTFLLSWRRQRLSWSRTSFAGSTLHVYGDIGNQTYAVASVVVDDSAGLTTALGISTNKHSPEDSAIAVVDDRTGDVYAHMRNRGFVQSGVSVNEAHVWAQPPRFIGTLPNELQPLDDTFSEPPRRRCAEERTEGAGMTTLRVGVVHTPQAAEAHTGESVNGSRTIEMIVAATIAEANVIVYPKSGINMRLKLCVNALLPNRSLEQTTASETLSRFRRSPEVESIRREHGCDTMTLFSTLNGLGNRACGIGYMFPGTHSVVADVCFQDNYSFLHELHHNFGSCHGFPFPQCGSGANGYGDPDHGFRTIEAYTEACGSTASACTRIPRVSNSQSLFHWNTWPIGNVRHNNAWLINMRKESMAGRHC